MADDPGLGRVLVVDDDENVRRLLAIKLRRTGAEVELAPDRATAVAVAASAPPDLVVLGDDLADGGVAELAASLRGVAEGREPTGTTASLPAIVVLSARSSPAHIRAALDAGADDYVTKPFSPQELIHRLMVVRARRSLLRPGS